MDGDGVWESSIRGLFRGRMDSSFVVIEGFRGCPSGGVTVGGVDDFMVAGGRSVTVVAAILGPAGLLSSLLSIDKRSIVEVAGRRFLSSGIPSTVCH